MAICTKKCNYPTCNVRATWYSDLFKEYLCVNHKSIKKKRSKHIKECEGVPNVYIKPECANSGCTRKSNYYSTSHKQFLCFKHRCPKMKHPIKILEYYESLESPSDRDPIGAIEDDLDNITVDISDLSDRDAIANMTMIMHMPDKTRPLNPIIKDLYIRPKPDPIEVHQSPSSKRHIDAMDDRKIEMALTLFARLCDGLFGGSVSKALAFPGMKETAISAIRNTEINIGDNKVTDTGGMFTVFLTTFLADRMDVSGVPVLGKIMSAMPTTQRKEININEEAVQVMKELGINNIE